MSHVRSSQFVQSVADEFFRRYDSPVSRNHNDDELWIECKSSTPTRFRSPLSFGITPDSVTVAFDGLTRPFLVHPGRDAETTRRQAFALFDDLTSERQVAISFWRGDDCIAIEFIQYEQIHERKGAWRDSGANRVRVRSWLGKYDYESVA